MSKLNAGLKVTRVLPHDEVVHEYPNPEYRHNSDETKNEQAIKGDFGTKKQLSVQLNDVQKKYPGIEITHRHNSTVR